MFPETDALAELILALAPKLPAFERPTEYVALVDPLVHVLTTADGSNDAAAAVPVRQWASVANEVRVAAVDGQVVQVASGVLCGGRACAFQPERAVPAPGGGKDGENARARERCAKPIH